MAENAYLTKAQLLVIECMTDITGVKVYLFGSWARGEQKTSSDIDIAVDGLPFDKRYIIRQIRERFEESDFPYNVDVVDMNFASESLRQRILQEGILWRS